MKINEKIKAILEYFYKTRGVGHTKVTTSLAPPDLDYKVLFHSERMARQYKNGVTLHELEGRNTPLVLDNFMVTQLLEESIKKIEFLERQNETLSGFLNQISFIAKGYQAYNGQVIPTIQTQKQQAHDNARREKGDASPQSPLLW